MSGCTDTVNYVHSVCNCSCHMQIPYWQIKCNCNCNIRLTGTTTVNSPPLQNDHEERIKELEDKIKEIAPYAMQFANTEARYRIEQLEKQCADKPKKLSRSKCLFCNGTGINELAKPIDC